MKYLGLFLFLCFSGGLCQDDYYDDDYYDYDYGDCDDPDYSNDYPQYCDPDWCDDNPDDDYCDDVDDDYEDYYDDYDDDYDLACDCTDAVKKDGNSGKTIGQCLTKINEKYWCYVDADSECSDKKKSAREEGLYWSFEACSGRLKDEPAPQIAGKEIRGLKAKSWKKRNFLRQRQEKEEKPGRKKKPSRPNRRKNKRRGQQQRRRNKN